MDSANTITPTGTVVVRPGQGDVSLHVQGTQGAHYSQDTSIAARSISSAPATVPAEWVFTPITRQNMWRVLKRAMDVLGGIVGLVLGLPVWMFAAIVVKVDDGGRVLFKQVRIGKDGRPFEMLKFRTMCADAEVRKADLVPHNQMTGPVFKMYNDPRVTRLGRFLRKYSIDEVPQFWNVIRGEMSLVGPRPALPSEVNQYQPWQRERLCVKPGLTCLWQVNGRNEADFNEWMQLDLEYIHRSSFTLDCVILLKTIPAVLRGTGV